MNASLTELNLLSHLAVLSLKIPRVECLPRDFVFPRLLKYDIVLGNGYSKTAHPTSPRLYLNDISAASLNAKTFEQLFPTVSQICFIDVEDLENIVFGAQMTSHGHGSQKDFLQRLEDVKVKGCRDTRTLFPAKWRQAFNNLTSVEIEDCESLEEVFELGEAGEGSSEVQELRLLSSLTRLLLRRLPELKCIWKGPTRHVSLRSLVHLELQFLDKLTFIFTLSLAQSLDHLETLRIDDCSGLKHLIGEEKDDEREIIPESLGFPKLKTLSISGCDQLEYVFPVSVSPSLLNLEEMEIAFGANLKQIFYSGEGDALTRDGIINFPLLRELSLSRCDFCGPKNFTAQLPSLQVLAIEGHEELGDFLAQLQGHTNLRKIRITDCKGAQELMQVGSFATNRRTSHGSQKDFLQRLEDVKVKGCRDTRSLFPAKSRQALNNLTSVEIEDCKSLEEVFELGEADEGSSEVKELRLLSSLTRIRLSRLPELKCIWKGPTRHVSLRSLIHLELRSLHKLTFIFKPHLAQSLVHLETLRIEYCSGLKHLIREKDDEREIIPESLGFPKLKTLSISGCHKLEYVFPVSVSPSLLNLEEMTIVFDANLKQIFYSGEGDALTRDGIINIPQLRKFTLSNCCSVFGPRNFTAQLPSLQVLAIEGHEELGDLLAQLQGHTNLRVIRIIDCKRAPELMQVGSFGTNGRTGHELSLLSLEKLDLSSLPDMRCIWKGLVLSHLTTLEVSRCEKLTHVFTGSMVASLVQLKLLVIVDCSELEQIIAKDNDDEKDQILSGSDLQSLCFPNLCEIFIMRCNKLRSLFPVAMAAGLPKLEDLDVRDSSQLLGVFWQDDDASPVNVEKQMMLPNLSSLRLYNLQSIVCFSLGCDDFLFPRLGNPMVDKCPKLTTKFANKTNASTSA